MSMGVHKMRVLLQLRAILNTFSLESKDFIGPASLPGVLWKLRARIRALECAHCGTGCLLAQPGGPSYK